VPLRVPFISDIHTSLASCIFPEKWKPSFVMPIFKNGKRNDVFDYREIIIRCAVAKLFELLICTAGACMMTLEAFSFKREIFLVHSDDGKWIQVDSVYTDFLQDFYKVRHCLLLLKFTFSPIDFARCELL
jgi:hypothetical protein